VGQRRQLAGKAEGAVQYRVEERLLPKTIPCGEELLPPSVVDGNANMPSSRSTQAGLNSWYVQNRFGVGRCFEPVTLTREADEDPGGCRFRR
jgi:hypothetical protein